MRTGYCYHQQFDRHTRPGHPENAGRLRAILSHLHHSQLIERLVEIPADPAHEQEIARIHTLSYINKVRQLCARGGGHLDPDTYLTTASFEAALRAAGGLLALTRAVLAGRLDNGVALVRPPGHHATAGRGMGFCLFNNVAIAAADALTLSAVERVLIVDYDVHHGNGSQEAFAADPAVALFSLHQFPHYPGTGLSTEIGHNAGRGTIINIPLPAGVGDEGYAQAITDILWPLARRYDPQLMLVSAGYDAHWADPLAGMGLSLAGFASIDRQLLALADELCDGRIVYTLEGGYHPTVLATAIHNLLATLLRQPGPPLDPLGPYPRPETPVAGHLAKIRQIHDIQ